MIISSVATASVTLRNATSTSTAANTASGITATDATTYLPSSLANENLTYSAPRRSLSWATPPEDSISEHMQSNVRQGSIAQMLEGLGHTLLGRIGKTSGSYQQSVSEITAGATGSVGSGSAVSGHHHVDLQITLASGRTVTVSIAFDPSTQSKSGGLAVSINTDGDLSQGESAAIAKLADGFDNALQGIGANSDVSPVSAVVTPIDLSGLMQFDDKFINSVDLKVSETSDLNLNKLNFHADSAQRSFSMKGINGEMSFNVDLTGAAIPGTEAQQAASIEKYLAQFDAANARAQGEKQLIEQFKSIFSQLESKLPGTPEKNTPASSTTESASRDYFTGLADFTASMSGKFSTNTDQRLATKMGTLRYEVSQQTSVSNREVANNPVTATQTVTSHLVADTLKGRNGLAVDLEHGNYDRYHINDSSTSTTRFTTQGAKVLSATSDKIVNQFQHFERIENHRVTQSTDTPNTLKLTRDLLQSI
jgi:hypothetical protein